MVRKIWRVCRQEGLKEAGRRSVRRVLSWSGDSLLRAAARLEQSRTLSREDRACLARNSTFRDRHAGRRCFVIGNGPSLKRQDLTPLADEITLTMSGFWKHPVLDRWQPTYYCLADPLFFDGSEPMRKFFADLSSRIRSTTFFVPLSARRHIQRLSLLPMEQTCFVAFHGDLGNGLPSRPDLTETVPGVQSVSQLAIMIAMYMGCSPIYLLGLDHDWLAQRGMDRHFYGGLTVEGHPIAHGDLDRLSYKSDLIAVLNMWNGYEQIRQVGSRHKIQILNATDGGFLDIFPRVKYVTLFPEVSPRSLV